MGPMETLASHEFHPRVDFPVICAACGRHEHSMIHKVRVEQGPKPR